MAPLPLTAQAVADLVGGRLLGQGEAALERIGPLDRADGRTLSFLVSSRYLPYFRASTAGAVLVTSALSGEAPGPATRIVVPDPYEALRQLIPVFYPECPQPPGIDPTARIGTGAVLGAEVYLGPWVVLGRGVQIGSRSRLGPGVVLEEGVTLGEDCDLGPHVFCGSGTVLGNRVRLKAGAVIGGQGFGYATGPEGHRHLRHVGRCILEDEVEIGSGTCVDRGSLDDTVVGRGTKIDNLVQVAHNVRIGQHCLIMATVGIAGSVRIGDRVIVAGGVGVADHVRVGDGARISAKSAVIGDVPPGATWGGYPARSHRDFLRGQATIHRLVPLVDDLERLLPGRSPSAKTNH